MNWIKLETDIFSTPEYILAEPTDRATWMALLIFCAKNENNGTIANCLHWKDRTWQQLAAVTIAEVNRTSTLVEWKGTDLTVKFYPTDTEELLKTKRVASAKGHQAKAAKAALLAMPESQYRQCHNGQSGNATPTARIEVLAMQRRVEKSRVDKSRTDRPPEAPEGRGEEGGNNFLRNEAAEFSAWFNLYPKQIGEIEAQREWMACSHQRPPLAEMIDRLTSHINSQEWQADDGKFIPRAAAYINGQRWRDKLTPGRKIRALKKTPEPHPQVDDNAALRWLRENYDHCEMESTDTYCKPFRDWPELARKEYLKHLTKKK